MVNLTGTGIWSSQLRYDEPAAIADEVAELESLGYRAAWIPDTGGEVLDALDRLLEATTTMTIATGILNIWMHPAGEVAEWWSALPDDRRSRVLLGLGVSHPRLIGEKWGRPIAVMTSYLDELDEAGLPASARCLAALGPKMLELARQRSAGAHPYHTTVEHTSFARKAIGPDALLSPELPVVLETDPERARGVARQGLEHYVVLPNYTNNWRRLGFTDDDITGPSDRLVDALVAWGDVDAIASRVADYRAAGADHVCVQVVTERGRPAPRDQWRALAAAVT
jgi:probable F420-dependent oxidoreductase